MYKWLLASKHVSVHFVAHRNDKLMEDLQSDIQRLLNQPVDTRAPSPNASTEQVTHDKDIDLEIDDLVQQDSGVLDEFSDMIEHQAEPVGKGVSDKLANIINKLLRVELKENTLFS